MVTLLVLSECARQETIPADSRDGGDGDPTDDPAIHPIIVPDDLCYPTPGWERLDEESPGFPAHADRVVTTVDERAHFYRMHMFDDEEESSMIPFWSYDGSAWTRRDAVRKIPYHYCVTAAFASGNNLVASNCGGVAVFDGDAWTQIREDKRYVAVWGAPDGTVFLSTGAQVLMDSGAGPQPTAGEHQAGIFALWGTSSSDVYGVGVHGVFSHFDGSGWGALTFPGNADDFFATLWGAGSQAVFTGHKNVIYVYDGDSWSSQNLGGGNEWIYKIDGNGPEDVYAQVHNLGDNGEGEYYRVYGFDGTSWTTALDIEGGVDGGGIETMAALDSGEVYVVERDASGDRFLSELNGVGPTLPLNALPISLPSIEAIAGTSSDDIHLFGRHGRFAHYDGAIWKGFPIDLEEYFEQFRDVSSVGVSDEQVVVFDDGLYVRWDGATWTTMGQGEFNVIYELTGSGPDDIFIGNNFGKWYHWDGASWDLVTDPDWDNIEAIRFFGQSSAAATLRDDGYKTGFWDGSSWSIFPTDEIMTGSIRYLWGLDGQNLYGFQGDGMGPGEMFFRLTEQEWTMVDSYPGERVDCMGGRYADDVIAMGKAGKGGRFDGDGWSSIDLCVEDAMNSVSVTPAGVAYVVGNKGHFWRHQGE